MSNTKKQLKITKLFRKAAAKSASKAHIPDDCDVILEEIQQLQERLREKQDELFQIQRHSYKHKVSVPKQKSEKYIKPESIILTNSIEGTKRDLNLMVMLTGVEVQSYVVEDHCCIVYHLQNNGPLQIKHGLRIEMQHGAKAISKSSMPVGFNLKAVTDDFDNVMMPECLGAIRTALVAYYDRLDQFEKLKTLLNMEAQLFKLLDGSHMEISFYVQNVTDEDDERIHVTLILNYRIYDIRPKTYMFKESDLPEGVSEILKQQCAIFKKKPLDRAFKDAFMTGVGTYKLFNLLGYREASPQRRRAHRRRQTHNAHDAHDDDTFLPEDCSDQGEDDDVED